MIPAFQSLDFVYIPTADVTATAARYVTELGATLRWRVRAMETMVACIELPTDAQDGRAGAAPAILLSGHLKGVSPILIYRVDDYTATVDQLRDAGVDLRELEIPHGPVAVFSVADGQRLAVYELTRPESATHFDGRFDD